MHRQILHQRLVNYLAHMDFNEVDVQDGYYRMLMQVKVDDENDLIQVKHASFQKYLGEAQQKLALEDKKDAFKSKFKLMVWHLFRGGYIFAASTIVAFILMRLFYAH